MAKFLQALMNQELVSQYNTGIWLFVWNSVKHADSYEKQNMISLCTQNHAHIEFLQKLVLFLSTVDWPGSAFTFNSGK